MPRALMNISLLRPRLLVSCCLILCLAGCGDADSGTVEVSGTVTVDGEPLPDGDILFRPLDASGRADAAKIVDGKFNANVLPGSKRVEIAGFREVVPDLPPNAPEAGTPVNEQYLPARYNDASTLEADITDGGEPLRFELTTEP